MEYLPLPTQRSPGCYLQISLSKKIELLLFFNEELSQYSLS